MAIALRTELIRDYKFPVFPGEKFVSELVVYNEMDEIAPMVWIDIPIYIFEYQEDGYTRNSRNIRDDNPYGTACAFLSDAKYGYSLLQRVKAFSAYKAIKKIAGLDEHYLQIPHMHWYEKLAAKIIRPHYERLLNK